MKKTLLISMLMLTGIFLGWKIYHSKDNKKTLVQNVKPGDEKNINDKDDGILLAQQQEFEMTKDIVLGYVPENRLIDAIEQLKTARLNNTYASRVDALTWTERGPNSDGVGPSGNPRPGAPTPATSGRMRAIWVDVADPTNKTVWVGGIDGGIWKTTNITASPATWTQPTNGDFYSNLAIGSICQDPTGLKNTMYFGTGEKTFNADAVQGGGIWKSTDHGVTWNLLPSTTTFWNVSKILCDGAGNVYVGTIGSGNGLERSTDGGNTWTNITPSTTGGGTRIADMVISSTGRLHVTKGYQSSANQFGYFYTDNPATVTAATWTSPVTTFTSSQYNAALTISSDGNSLYALPDDATDQTPQVWKSIDAGVHWAATTTSPPTTGFTPLSSGQGWYNLTIAMDPATPNNVFVGGLNGYRTTDGGLTWTPNSVWVSGVPGSTNYVHADHQVAVWNGNQLLVGTDGGIFYSADGGATFTDRNVGLRLKQFYSCAIHPTTTNYFLAGAQDNGCHQLTNAGLGSSTEVLGGDGAIVHIDQDEPQYQFGAYVFNQYRRSTDGGNTWANVNFSSTLGQFINPTDYDDINNKLYCGYSAGNYLRWDNPQTGSTNVVVPIALFNAAPVTHVMKSPYTANRVFFGTSGGKIIKVDNANAITPVATDITGSSMTAATVSCVAMGTNDNNLIATFSNSGAIHVWMSTTGGGAAAWTNISGNLPDIPVRWAMFYPEDNTKAILATEMGIYETSLINGAATVWVQNSSFPVVKTNMLQYRPSDGTVAAATHGRGLWTSTIPFTVPYVRFAFDYNSQPETTVSTTGCRYYKDYVINMKIDIAPTGNANITLTPAGGGTATQGVDYDFTTNGSFAAPSNTLTFANGSTTPQPITIRIYDDAEAESTESFTLNYSIGGGTNAIAAPSSSSYTFTITDNDLPVAATNAIATTAGNTKTENVVNNGAYYFYSGTNIINGVSAASANLGCVTSSIFEAGSVWQTFDQGQRSQKVFEIIPTTNLGSSYTVNLYFTAAELAAYSATPANLKIAKTSAATMATADATNTIRVPTTFAAYGAGYVFTASFTGFSKFFLVNNAVTLPISLISFAGTLNNNSVLLNWNTTAEQNSRNFDIEKSTDGINFYKIGSVSAAGNSSVRKDYSFSDLKLSDLNYYRLRMNDIDGNYKLSQVVLVRYSVPKQNIWVVNNPFQDHIDLRFAKQASKVKLQLVTINGALISEKVFTNSSSQIHWELPGNISKGIYVLRAIADGELFITKLMKQ